MIEGLTPIHPHNMGLLILRGISCTAHFGHAKRCLINAFDTNYLMSADEVMASILHLPQNMDEELTDSDMTALDGLAPSDLCFCRCWSRLPHWAWPQQPRRTRRS
jgi:hypothetical protein